jgi:hypothetical protein
MTDVTPPTGPHGPYGELTGAGDELTPEELACGYLDDELAPGGRARVEADPALMALVADLRAVSGAVAAPVPPLTEDQRSAMVTAALGALPTSGAPVGPTSGATVVGGTVTSLDAARNRRSTRFVRTVAGGLAAAAAVGLVALVVTRGGGDRGDDSTAGGGAATVALEAGAGGEAADTTDATVDAASADAAPADTSAQDAAALPASEAPAAATEGATSAASARPTTTASSAGGDALPELGPLADRAEARAAAERFATDFAAGGPGPCAEYPPPFATATFQGVPAYLVLLEANPEGNRFALVDQATCAVLVKVDTTGR